MPDRLYRRRAGTGEDWSLVGEADESGRLVDAEMLLDTLYAYRVVDVQSDGSELTRPMTAHGEQGEGRSIVYFKVGQPHVLDSVRLTFLSVVLGIALSIGLAVGGWAGPLLGVGSGILSGAAVLMFPRWKSGQRFLARVADLSLGDAGQSQNWADVRHAPVARLELNADTEVPTVSPPERDDDAGIPT